MVDFGNLGSGRPAFDVATLLSSTLVPGPDAPSRRDRFVGDYPQALVDEGVVDHSLAQFRNDLDVCLILHAYLLVLAAGHYEADYSGASLAEIWASRIIGLLPEEVPTLGEVIAA